MTICPDCGKYIVERPGQPAPHFKRGDRVGHPSVFGWGRVVAIEENTFARVRWDSGVFTSEPPIVIYPVAETLTPPSPPLPEERSEASDISIECLRMELKVQRDHHALVAEEQTIMARGLGPTKSVHAARAARDTLFVAKLDALLAMVTEDTPGSKAARLRTDAVAEVELDAYAEGRKHALERVVAWLRSPGADPSCGGIAEQIENGDHERPAAAGGAPA